MKRILLLFSLLIPANSLLGMQLFERHEPSERIRNYADNALKAFEIPKESVKIYGFTHSNITNSVGFTNTETREISIHENTDDNLTEYTSFHEVAHMKDNASQKSKIHAALLSGAVGIPALLLPFLLAKTEIGQYYAATSPLSFFFANLAYDGSIALFWKQLYVNYAHPWAVEQCEYRADKMALEKLIELSKKDSKKLYPIMAFLNSLKTRNSEHAKYSGHPRASNEYAVAKKILIKKGFTITETKDGLDLVIAIYKDGLQTSLNIADYYLLKDGLNTSISLENYYLKKLKV